MSTFHDLSAQRLEGGVEALSIYKGSVALVVNVASECGYTPQYAGLQALHDELKDRGFNVLGFPCNQFGAQEPGESEQIQGFCRRNFGVTYPMFQKVDVKGPGQSPIYAFLAEGHGEPQWNFHKYLVGKDGQVLATFKSGIAPDSVALRSFIEDALA